MSEPITRERIWEKLYRAASICTEAAYEARISADKLAWAKTHTHNPAESASPPRVPGASAKLEADFREFIKKAEPGNLAELIETVAYERGRRAGIEAAAQAIKDKRYAYDKRQTCHEAHEQARREHLNALVHLLPAPELLSPAAIRALADKPAPDVRLPGLEHVRENMERVRSWDLLSHIAWLDAEIAACKGG